MTASVVSIHSRRKPEQAPAPVSHNLNGQRLGRKGRDTRERIIAVTTELLGDPDEDGLITLSEVARRANLRMSTLYLYFADLTELMLAVLAPVMASAEEEYVCLLREHWPDDELDRRPLAFVAGYFNFWGKNSRLLHLRNSMADRGDPRMMEHRVRSAMPVMRLIASQMGTQPTEYGNAMSSMATALMTGLERVATVMTDVRTRHIDQQPSNPLNLVMEAQARLFELAIRDQRRAMRSNAAER
jgi:AcrR family transcriptional regulator